jgi:hypothetical protein
MVVDTSKIKSLSRKCAEDIEVTDLEQTEIEVLLLAYEFWLERELGRVKFFVKEVVDKTMNAEQKAEVRKYMLQDEIQPEVAQLLRSIVGESPEE